MTAKTSMLKLSQMGRLKLLLIVLLLAPIFSAERAVAQSSSAQNFSILDFSADYFLDRNSQKTSVLSVNERIIAQFPNYDQNHGILRAIPQRYQDHTLSLKINSVKDDKGNPLSYTTYKQADNLVLKIGDGDRYVHGVQTYVINYQMSNVVSIFSDHEEFYWDVNGDQWPQTFEAVKANIHISNELANSLQDRQACYSGSFGQTESQCEINRLTSDSKTVVNVSNKRFLGPNQTLTFVLGFSKDTFTLGPEVTHEKIVHNLKIAGAIAGAVIPPVIAFGIMLNRWRKFGNDPKGRGIIVAQYEPPKGLSALRCDFLLHEDLRNLALSALLIELATKGYITIKELSKKGLFGKKDYELTLQSLPRSLLTDTKEALQVIFGDGLPTGEPVKLSDFKPSSERAALSSKMQALEKSLSKRLTKLGYFIKDPLKIRQSYIVWALLPFIGGFTLLILLGGLFLPAVGLGAGLIVAAIVMFSFAFIMPARSALGVEINDALLGLKDYIKLAEADRLKFLQSPEGAEKVAAAGYDGSDPKMKVKLFESLLPYAMLFGLEKQWAKQFADIYKQPPDWYQGNFTTFNTAYLISSVKGFTAQSSATFTSPSSSSSSGFSGGSSGGGGGGGGGGGW